MIFKLLSPMKYYDIGITALNKKIQDFLNSLGPRKKIKVGRITLYENDKVINI